MTVTLSNAKNRLVESTGSRENTSNPAPASLPSCSASKRASSSIIADRAVLIRCAVGFIQESCSCPIIRKVTGVARVCSVTKSAWRISGSSSTFSAPTSFPFLALTCGSKKSTRVSKPWSLFATRTPICPNPMIPTVLRPNSFPFSDSWNLANSPASSIWMLLDLRRRSVWISFRA